MGQAQVCEDVVQGFPFVGAGVEFDAFPEGEQVVALGCRDGVEAVEFFVDGERCGAVLLVGQHAVYASGMVAVNPADECKQVAFSGAEEVVYLVHVAVVLVLFLPFGTETAGSQWRHAKLHRSVHSQNSCRNGWYFSSHCRSRRVRSSWTIWCVVIVLRHFRVCFRHRASRPVVHRHLQSARPVLV